MKITLTIKIILLASLLLILIISYIINRYVSQFETTSESNSLTIKQESAEQYNKRKNEEAIQQRAKKEKELKTRKTENKIKLTIDGYDPATRNIIDPINLWGNYETRTYAGQVKHGEIVTLIKREGDGVFIETNSGLKGWITYFFIEEFNKEAEKR